MAGPVDSDSIPRTEENLTLEDGVQQGSTQKSYRGMVYKFFAGLV